MASLTRRSKLWYAFFAGAGGTLAYYRHGRSSKDAKFPDFPDLSSHHTVMAKKLTQAMYNSMRFRISPSGFTLDKCIQAGVDIKGSALGRKDAGLVAGDAECYDIFRDLFEDVLSELHPARKEHKKSLADCGALNAVFDPRQVLALKFTCYRNLEDFPFTPAMTRAQRRLVETSVQQAFAALPRLLAGEYKTLKQISAGEYEKLSARGCMLAKPATEEDRISGLVRDWPDARGVFYNAAHNLYVWVNGRHHLQIVSHEAGGNVGQALRRLAEATGTLEQALLANGLRFQWEPLHGYLGHDLKEVGNAMCLEATMNLPNFGNHYEFLKQLKALRLYAIPNEDEKKGIWKLALLPSFGSEVEQAQAFIRALDILLQSEQALAETGKLPV